MTTHKSELKHPAEDNKPWVFCRHLVGKHKLHYTVHNYVTGETLCTYRQIKKARNVVRQLNNGAK